MIVTKLLKLFIRNSLDPEKYNDFEKDIVSIREKSTIKAKFIEVKISPKIAHLFKI